LKKKELAVGDSTEAELIFVGTTALGKISKSATIITNDTISLKPYISFSAEIVSNFDSTFPVTISPCFYNFAEGKNPLSFKAKITNASTENLSLRVINYPQELVKIKLKKDNLKPGKTTELEVKLDKKLKDTDFKNNLTLEVEGKEKARFTIPLTNKPKPPAAATKPAEQKGK
jgi:hypothetical protein